jgi:hypothetical protein
MKLNLIYYLTSPQKVSILNFLCLWILIIDVPLQISLSIQCYIFISENYVYDLYTVEKDGDTKMDDIQADYPL